MACSVETCQSPYGGTNVWRGYSGAVLDAAVDGRMPIDPPILIAGPTASGKSALALALAERFGGVVINADSMQVYASCAF